MVQKRKKQKGSREEKVLGAGMGVPLVLVAGSTWCLGNNMVTFFQCCWWGVVRVGGVWARNLLTTAAIKNGTFLKLTTTVGFVACKCENRNRHLKFEMDWNPLRLLPPLVIFIV